MCDQEERRSGENVEIVFDYGERDENPGIMLRVLYVFFEVMAFAIAMPIALVILMVFGVCFVVIVVQALITEAWSAITRRKRP